MLWIAPTEKDTDNAALEKRLCDAADPFRANSGLKSQEYSAPAAPNFCRIQNPGRTRDMLLPRLLAGQVNHLKTTQ